MHTKLMQALRRLRPYRASQNQFLVAHPISQQRRRSGYLVSAPQETHPPTHVYLVCSVRPDVSKRHEGIREVREGAGHAAVLNDGAHGPPLAGIRVAVGVAAPAQNGLANRALEVTLSRALRCEVGDVSVVRGRGSRGGKVVAVAVEGLKMGVGRARDDHSLESTGVVPEILRLLRAAVVKIQ